MNPLAGRILLKILAKNEPMTYSLTMVSEDAPISLVTMLLVPFWKRTIYYRLFVHMKLKMLGKQGDFDSLDTECTEKQKQQAFLLLLPFSQHLII